MTTLNFFLVLVSMAPDNPSIHDKDLSFVKNVFLANVSRCEFGHFAFRVSQGSAGSIQDVKLRRIKNVVQGQGLYKFNHDNALFAISYAKSDIIANTVVVSENQYKCLYENIQLLTDRFSTCLDTASTVDFNKKLVRSSIEVYADRDQNRFRSYYEFVLPFGQNPDDFKLLVDLQSAKDRNIEVAEYTLTSGGSDAGLCKISFKYKNNYKRHYLA